MVNNQVKHVLIGLLITGLCLGATKSKAMAAVIAARAAMRVTGQSSHLCLGAIRSGATRATGRLARSQPRFGGGLLVQVPLETR